MIIVGLIALLTGSAAIADLTWGYSANLTLWDASISAGYFVQMYQDVNSDSNLGSISAFDSLGVATGTGVSDDVLLGTFTSSLLDVKGSISWTSAFTAGDWGALMGQDVYSVIYDNSSIAAASFAVVVDASSATLGGSDPYTYSQGTVDNSWVAVPEPATAMLLALGGGLAWLVRLKQRMS